ncbi:alpha/beta-hydrolase family protein [Pseudooceanicola sp. HF7]|uniref:alpha/beta hydrolase n=1 Tax=Pseudooceanicola sp. HF7 TaxID=2721560 RepID=UPI001430DF22|nr:alpha/beta-hydrolase family protein [Pseudooceanicola sp. HF7]NIZ08177.1 hypothetical protein [Pseudooceanicola sp. HF7]
MKITLTRGVTFQVFPLLLGLLLFAASLSPSLIPRSWVFEGVLGGVLTAIGYLVGRVLQLAWLAAGLPSPRSRSARIALVIFAIPVLVLWIYALWNTTDWQNSIRARVGMPPIESTDWTKLLILSVLVFAACYLLGVLVSLLFRTLRNRLYRIMPARTANLLGVLLAVALLFVMTMDGLVPFVIRTLDSSYEEAQRLFDTAPPAPRDPRRAGSAESLVGWQQMGQPGRDFIQNGPGAAAITAVTGRPALDPIRVYVGRAQDNDPQVRAQVALKELIRLQAFDRAVLVVASPTGTGWLDPSSFDPLEYIHDGDIATVAAQYSYMQSPMALIFETDTGLDQAKAMFTTVYDYWKDLPPDSRPRLYVHGLSLGAWSSMYAVDLLRIFDDPIQGAFWVGSPFLSTKWRDATAARNLGSPFVSPEVGDGALIRFFTQYGGLERATADWARMRVIYLQHASDGIVFYDPASLWRAPPWLREPPAPDVSPEIRFLPIVTQFQLAIDMMLSLGMPLGYGHSYAPREYLTGWIELSDPANWTDADTARLMERCSGRSETGCDNR